ncbi:MAG: gamma-glutamyltransferase [Wenzhouxiangella sp.]|nr:MAG: gamma-glutamyltransferase [Wenzhouxiangella sp.]
MTGRSTGQNRRKRTGQRSFSWRVASGHADTSQAAVQVLEAGGNAADAAVAAALAATVAEPLLCSLGGGAHALVQAQGRAPLALDCFTHTPRHRRLDELDFYPIIGNFGTDVQEFHVGMASIATPGAAAGLLALHGRFGRMPLAEVIAPARRLAAEGVVLNDIQTYALHILEPIVRATEASARLFGLDGQDAPIPAVGARVCNPDLADFLDQLPADGVDNFYRGELAQRLAADSSGGGGHLRLADLDAYRVRWRRPLRWQYRDATLWSTPPPAFGGMMLALACASLARHLQASATFGSPQHLEALCHAMIESEDLRQHLEQPQLLASERALRGAFAGLCQQAPFARRGTTHISVDDGRGLVVAMTLSNGEGSGYVLPGTGIILNNMLGEEDINRTGFHTWPTNRRLASMMAPTILARNGQRWLLGSGGSNRIRTALAQVIANLVDFELPLDQAIVAPRLHLERACLAVELPEDAWSDTALDWLSRHYPDARCWPARNMYFGGVHAVGPDQAAADPRRQGCAREP